MKVAELRQRLAKYDQEQLRAIIAEMYKLVPKKVIEDKEIDRLLTDPAAFASSRKQSREEAKIDMDELRAETEQFLDDAYKQHYFAPNRVIAKKDRPKWRFIVKRLADQLCNVAGRNETDAAEALRLLEKLYRLLCNASASYLFSTDDPFSSVRTTQYDFFRRVVALKKRLELPAVWMRGALALIVEGGTDRHTFTESLLSALLEFADTAPLKELAIEQSKLLIRETKAAAASRKDSWDRRHRLQTLHLMVFFSYLHLRETDAAIDYFKRHYRDSTAEVELFVLLKHLFSFDLKSHWLREFEAAKRNGVGPRPALQRMHAHIVSHDAFPQHMMY